MSALKVDGVDGAFSHYKLFVLFQPRELVIYELSSTK
jgi:hypothetical protein